MSPSRNIDVSRLCDPSRVPKKIFFDKIPYTFFSFVDILQTLGELRGYCWVFFTATREAYSMHPWTSASLMRTNPPMSLGILVPTFPRSISSSGRGRLSSSRDSRSNGIHCARFSGVILLPRECHFMPKGGITRS